MLVLVAVGVSFLALLPSWWQPAYRIYGHHYFASSPVKFDAAAWKRDELRWFCEPDRYRMSLHIADADELRGLDRAKVRALLDSPDDEGTDVGTDFLVYRVRRRDASSNDFLTVKFDNEGRVVRTIAPWRE
jgi:hypothetical protein